MCTTTIAKIKEQRKCVECNKDFVISFKTQKRCKKCVFNSDGGRKKQTLENNRYLDVAHPELVPYFDVEKNASIGIKIRDYSITSHIKMWFKCPSCSFEFFLSMASFVKKKQKCKQCRHKEKAEKTCVDCNNIFYSYDSKVVRCYECIKKKVDLSFFCNKNPRLFQKLNPNLNPGVDLSKLKMSNDKIVNWFCKKCNQVQSSSTLNLQRNKFKCYNCIQILINKKEEKKLNIKLRLKQQKKELKIKNENKKLQLKQKKIDQYKVRSQFIFDNIFKNKQHILKELHPTKNEDFFNDHHSIPPTKKSVRKLNWVCSNCNHEWKASIRSRASEKTSNYYNSGKECPRCSSFAGKNTEKLKDWDYNKNINIDPYTIPPTSNKKYHWICRHCKQDWISSTINCNCPNCTPKHSSIIERKLYYLFTLVFGKYNVKSSFKFHKNKEIDIFIPKYKIGIEYDGAFFHKDEKRDVLKNSLVKTHNYQLYRIREMGLSKLKPDDYIYNSRKNLQEPFLYLVDKINKNYKLSSTELKNIEYVKTLDYDNLNIPKSFLIYPLAENSIVKTHNHIAVFFNKEHNKIFTPNMLTKGMGHKVFWNCKQCGTLFERSVNINIKLESVCKICLKHKNKKFDFKRDFPNLYVELYKPENQIIKDIGNSCEWSCNLVPGFPHTYYASIKARLKGVNCKVCNNVTV